MSLSVSTVPGVPRIDAEREGTNTGVDAINNNNESAAIELLQALPVIGCFVSSCEGLVEGPKAMSAGHPILGLKRLGLGLATFAWIPAVFFGPGALILALMGANAAIQLTAAAKDISDAKKYERALQCPGPNRVETP